MLDAAKANVLVGFTEAGECFFGFVALCSVDACVCVGEVFGHGLFIFVVCCVVSG